VTDLILLPDVEQLVADFLLDQAEILEFFDLAVDNNGNPIANPKTDRVYTELPSTARWPAVRVSRFTGTPRPGRIAWLDQAFLQIDAFGGPKKLARRLGETCRAALDQRLPGVHALGVVTGVRTLSFGYHPDDTYQPARPKYDFVAVITLHPNPDSAGS
jgi:hypothetical protein